MKVQPFMFLIGYDKDFKDNVKSGWGCGYVAIPIDSNLVKKHLESVEKQQSETDFYVSDYLQIGEQEITYTKRETIGGNEYLTIGFDTAHSYNGPGHGFEYVFKETVKLLTEVNNSLN